MCNRARLRYTDVGQLFPLTIDQCIITRETDYPFLPFRDPMIIDEGKIFISNVIRTQMKLFAYLSSSFFFFLY